MKDTSPEIEKIQFDLMTKMSADKRIAMACEMFMSARESFLNSLPKDLPDEEIKKQLYFRTYGKPLSKDFFERKSRGFRAEQYIGHYL